MLKLTHIAIENHKMDCAISFEFATKIFELTRTYQCRVVFPYEMTLVEIADQFIRLSFLVRSIFPMSNFDLNDDSWYQVTGPIDYIGDKRLELGMTIETSVGSVTYEGVEAGTCKFRSVDLSTDYHVATVDLLPFFYTTGDSNEEQPETQDTLSE